jgi:cysteine synthase A
VVIDFNIFFLQDPPGSALLTYFASDRKDMTADSGSTFLQGVGIARETSIIKLAHVDGGFRSDEQECIEMCDYLLRNEGLFVGPSAASNVCGAVKMAKLFGQGQVIATVLCDSGTQYATTVYDEAWRKKNKLVPVSKGKSIDFIKVGIHAGFRQYL